MIVDFEATANARRFHKEFERCRAGVVIGVLGRHLGDSFKCFMGTLGWSAVLKIKVSSFRSLFQYLCNIINRGLPGWKPPSPPAVTIIC